MAQLLSIKHFLYIDIILTTYLFTPIFLLVSFYVFSLSLLQQHPRTDT